MSTTKFTLKLPQKLKFSSLNKDFLFKPKKERCTQKNWRSKLKRLKLITLKELETKKWVWNLTRKGWSIKLKMMSSPSSKLYQNRKKPTSLLTLRTQPKWSELTMPCYIKTKKSNKSSPTKKILLPSKKLATVQTFWKPWSWKRLKRFTRIWISTKWKLSTWAIQEVTLHKIWLQKQWLLIKPWKHESRL